MNRLKLSLDSMNLPKGSVIYLAHSVMDVKSKMKDRIKHFLISLGYKVVDPSMFEYPPEQSLQEHLYNINFPIIEKCDLIICLKTLTPGVRSEKTYAETKKIAVIEV